MHYQDFLYQSAIQKTSFVNYKERNMTSTLSIITINYNNIDGLKKTIESVVTQTETDFEYIIIDGASTDGSSELIKEYAEHPEYGKKITHWVSEPDTGIYNAMNKGISKANGEYLHLLNSGDWYEPDALHHILSKLKEEKPDALLSMLHFYSKDILLHSELRYKESLYTSAILHQGLIYKKSLHDTVGLYDEQYRYAADYNFCVKAFLKKNILFSYVYTPCVNFDLGGVGESKKSREEFLTIQDREGFGLKPLPLYKKILKYITPYGLLVLRRKMQ